MILILSIAFILLAALVTLPLAKGAGPGRLGAFAALSILGVVAALALVSADVVPSFGDSEESVSEAEEKTIKEMEEALEAEIQLPLVSSPSVEALRSDQPSVWRFEQNFTVLCVPQDFPDSKALDCWAPDGVIGADPLPLEGEDVPEDPADRDELEDLDLDELDLEDLDLEDFEELE